MEHPIDIEKMRIALEKHASEDRARFDRYDRVLFGDEDNLGMVKENKEMYAILVQTRGLGSIIDRAKTGVGLILVLGALYALFKGWLIGLK